MREIKFRAWSGGQFPKMEDFVTIMDGKHWDCYHDCEIKGRAIMQYTGLKDKFGKEIYEGDIVGSYSSIGVVKYGECFINGQEYDCWGFYLDDEDKELLRYSEQKYSDYKIIGNIYESPKLLENTKT